MKIDPKKIRFVAAGFVCGFLACYVLLGASQRPQPGPRMAASGPPPVPFVITNSPLVFTAVRAQEGVESTTRNSQPEPLDLIETTPHPAFKLDDETK